MKKYITWIIILATCAIVILVNSCDLKILRVLTSSMEPEIAKGSIIIISKNNIYKTGDVISYKTTQNSTPITHRIIEIFRIHEKYFFITKGDNNDNKDLDPISEKEIIGKVILKIPYTPFPPPDKDALGTIFISTSSICGLTLGKLARKISKK